MAVEKTKDLWVFIETEDEGTAKSVGLELLVPGRRLADKQNGKLVAVILGSNVAPALEAVKAHGADEAIVVDQPELKHYNTDAYAKVLCELIEKYGPSVMLIGATNNGRDIGPRISCRLGTGLTADCTALDIDDETGNMAWTRPAFGGNLMATIMCPDHRPQLGTVRPGVFKKSEPGEVKDIPVIKEKVEITDTVKVAVALKGDTTLDGKVDATDLFETAYYVALQGAGKTPIFDTVKNGTALESKLAYLASDIDTESKAGENTEDGKLDATDMLYTAVYQAYNGAGNHIDWAEAIKMANGGK